MQLRDLVKPISEQTDDELLERLRQIRHNQEIVRPARAKIIEKVEKKASTQKMSKVGKLLEGLTDEQKAELLKQLEAD